jgi:hypothetical protein
MQRLTAASTSLRHFQQLSTSAITTTSAACSSTSAIPSPAPDPSPSPSHFPPSESPFPPLPTHLNGFSNPEGENFYHGEPHSRSTSPKPTSGSTCCGGLVDCLGSVYEDSEAVRQTEILESSSLSKMKTSGIRSTSEDTHF